MKCIIDLKWWDGSYFKAAPAGFDYIEVSLGEPSCSVAVKATISLEAAHKLGERLIALSQALEDA